MDREPGHSLPFAGHGYRGDDSIARGPARIRREYLRHLQDGEEHEARDAQYARPDLGSGPRRRRDRLPPQGRRGG